MLTIDAQVHVYERDHPGRPWADVLAGPPEVTGDDMAAAMDAVGVDAAILVSAWTMYRYDPSYAIAVRAAYPDRFALVKPVDPADASGLRAMDTIFQVELELSEDFPTDYYGQRVYVRFEHGTEPLALQWTRSLKQLFMRNFGV